MWPPDWLRDQRNFVPIVRQQRGCVGYVRGQEGIRGSFSRLFARLTGAVQLLASTEAPWWKWQTQRT